MAFATSLEMKSFLGEDEGVENVNDETTSPSGIAVETLLNMGTVSALTMEEERYNMFKEALHNSDEHYIRDGFHQVRSSFTFAFCSLSLRFYLRCSPLSLSLLFRINTVTIGRPCGTFNVYSTMD
jgi:hypothetical protein